MIVSQARHPGIFNAVCALVLITVCLIPYYYTMDEQNHTVFFPDRFIWVLTVTVLLCSSTMLWIISGKRKIVIEGTTIEVQINFGFKKVIFEASEIESMTWGGKTHTIGGGRNNKGMAFGNKFSEITFKDGSVLTIDEYNYKNCEEIMNWFFNYCRSNGIINVEAMERRKQERAWKRYKEKFQKRR
jgi:hypothetical protein